MLKANKITKVYNTVEGKNIVLDGIDFHGNCGELCMIFGKSGCGKSTFLNVLSCLDTFDSGTLEINGKFVNDMSRTDICNMRRSDIAFIFQGYNLISSMTAIENVQLGLKYRKIGRKQRNEMAKKALEQVGLSHRINYLPHHLSGGQQQRVAIARALVLSPKILFCDEPTGNLDKESSEMVMENINNLKQNGTLVIMITHDRSMLNLADRIFTLSDGKIIEQ